jgi:hypothetical protein
MIERLKKMNIQNTFMDALFMYVGLFIIIFFYQFLEERVKKICQCFRNIPLLNIKGKINKIAIIQNMAELLIGFDKELSNF